MTAYIGYIAAIGTSICWTFTSVFFTLSGRQVGSPIVNRTRLLLAMIFATITHTIILGQIFPFDAEPKRFTWLGLSALIGYVLGDASLFQAFVMIGPRLSMLLMALGPVFNTILGWVLFNEELSRQELLGIALTVAGVILVVTDRKNGETESQTGQEKPQPRRYLIGVLFGLGGSLGQAGGLLVSKLGVAGDFPALSGNLIRLVTATIIIWAITVVRGQAKAGFVTLKENPRALQAIVGGAMVGPFIGVWLSLIAVQKAPLGIASTLTSLAPIFLLPVGAMLFKEKIGLRAIAGTVAAMFGTAILFLPPNLMFTFRLL
jgi:drug/metabolite transporter (DMT)-like permease